MAKIAARLTGKVLVTEKRAFGSGDRQFRFTEARIQTGVASIETVRFTEDWQYDSPRVGDVLDLEVEISGFGGRNGVEVNLSARGYYDETFALSLAAAAA